LPDVLRLWDSLLADERRFDFLLYFCVAMAPATRREMRREMRGEAACELREMRGDAACEMRRRCGEMDSLQARLPCRCWR